MAEIKVKVVDLQTFQGRVAGVKHMLAAKAPLVWFAAAQNA